MNEQNSCWTLLFDENCPLCTRFANTVSAIDKKKSVSMQSYQMYYKQNQSIGLDQLSSDLHLINNNGDILTGSVAIKKMLEIIPESKPMKWMLTKSSNSLSQSFYSVAKRARKRCKKCGK